MLEVALNERRLSREPPYNAAAILDVIARLVLSSSHRGEAQPHINWNLALLALGLKVGTVSPQAQAQAPPPTPTP